MHYGVGEMGLLGHNDLILLVICFTQPAQLTESNADIIK